MRICEQCGKPIDPKKQLGGQRAAVCAYCFLGADKAWIADLSLAETMAILLEQVKAGKGG